MGVDISQLTDAQRKEVLRDMNRKNGRKGGMKVKERGPEYYRAIGRKGAATRWNKQKKDEQPQSEVQ